MTISETKPAKRLTCCCCDDICMGRQWWNRDKGFGLCSQCAERIEKRENADYMKECYGIKGYHYDLSNN